MKRIFTILACIFTAAVFMPAAVFADGTLQVPPAGDERNLTLWIVVIAAAAVAGIILAVIKLKGKNKQD